MGKANSKSWFHKTESMTCTPCSTIAINCHEVESNMFLRRNRIMNNLIPNKTYLTYIYI